MEQRDFKAVRACCGFEVIKRRVERRKGTLKALDGRVVTPDLRVVIFIDLVDQGWWNEELGLRLLKVPGSMGNLTVLVRDSQFAWRVLVSNEVFQISLIYLN